MPKINPDAVQEVADQLNWLYRTQAEGREKISEALEASARAGAQLAFSLASALGPGVSILADMMAQGNDFTDQLAQIANLVTGEPGDSLRSTLFDYGRDGMAVIVLKRTDDYLDLEIVVSEEAESVVVTGAKSRAEILGRALGVYVPVYKIEGSDPL